MDVLLCCCAVVSVVSTKSSSSLPGPYLQHVFIQAYKIWLTEDQIKVLQCFRHPEAFTLIQLECLLIFWYCYIRNSRVGELSHSSVVDGLKHAPGSVLEGFVAGNTIENEYGFNGFRTV